MNNSSLFNHTGLTGVLFIMAALIIGLHQAVLSPMIVQSMSAISPWLGDNLKVLYWVAAGFIFITGSSIPVIAMTTKNRNLIELVTVFGAMLWLVLGLLSIGFLLSLGWLWGKYLLS